MDGQAIARLPRVNRNLIISTAAAAAAPFIRINRPSLNPVQHADGRTAAALLN